MTVTTQRGTTPPTTSFTISGDVERRAGLRRMRIIATGLLVLAALIFVLTLNQDPYGLLGYVNAAAEAAMIGGLADWFAVTALFRHPLGIPIPHTAIIPRKKDGLGRALQTFVTDNFLVPEVFQGRLRNAKIGHRLAEWLEDPAHRERVLDEVTKLGGTGLGRIKDADVLSLVEDTIVPRLRKEDLSPVFGATLEGIVADKAHTGLVDMIFRELYSWLERHPEKFTDVIGERTPEWLPSWADRRLLDWSYQQAQEWVAAVRDQPDHPARIAIDDLLATVADDLQHDELMRERGERLKDRLLDHEQVGLTVVRLWDSVRDSLSGAMVDRKSSLWLRADNWLAEFGTSLSRNAQLRHSIENRVIDLVGFVVQNYGPRLAGVISHTVEAWDGKETSERIEGFVGKDLQYIRINGTVVGALAGLAIHGIVHAVSLF